MTTDKMKIVYAKLHLMQVLVNEERQEIFPKISKDEFLLKQGEKGSRQEMESI